MRGISGRRRGATSTRDSERYRAGVATGRWTDLARLTLRDLAEAAEQRKWVAECSPKSNKGMQRTANKRAFIYHGCRRQLSSGVMPLRKAEVAVRFE